MDDVSKSHSGSSMNQSNQQQQQVQSSNSSPAGSKGRIDVAVLIDLTTKSSNSHPDHRKEAYDEVKRACDRVCANVKPISFEKLAFGQTSVIDEFYSCDAVIVDLSVLEQQSDLFYHLGIRESFKMKQNILLFNESRSDSAAQELLKNSPHTCVAYRVVEGPASNVTTTTNSSTTKTYCIVTDGSPVAPDGLLTSVPDAKILLGYRIRKLLQDVSVQNKAHMKDKFLKDLKSARETYTGQDLSSVLQNLVKRLNDPNVASCETVHSMLLSFREIQDYDSMVNLVEDLESVPNLNFTSNPAILFSYTFALNRRNQVGDREKALNAILSAMNRGDEYKVADIVCLCGRIYKDIFTESDYQDRDALEKAIEWYRKGFQIQQSLYAGVNLATLLVVAGNRFETCRELSHIGSVLSYLSGQKGTLSTLKDYWDVATYFEISVLAENYHQALQVRHTYTSYPSLLFVKIVSEKQAAH